MHGNDVRVYSKAKDGATLLPDSHGHFKVREFACKDGTDTVFISSALVNVLEQIRMHFGKPMIINSGYRTEPYNKRIGGAPFSQHKYGTAADVVIKGVTPKDVATYARTLLPHCGGIGVYRTFTHIDVRHDKANWVG